MKICCGGFNLGEGLTLDGKTLNVAGNGGLPTPKKDGVALIGYNGQFIQTSGYGYEEPKAWEDIVWDGDTEGRATAEFIFEEQHEGTAYKIAEYLDSSQLIGATITMSFEGMEQAFIITEDTIFEMSEGFYAFYDAFLNVKAAGTYDYGAGSITFPEAGMYVSDELGLPDAAILKITAAANVQQFDEKYVPNARFIVNVTMGDGVAVADKTIKQIYEHRANCVCLCGNTILPLVECTYEEGSYDNTFARFSLMTWTDTISEESITAVLDSCRVVRMWTSGTQVTTVGSFGDEFDDED